MNDYSNVLHNQFRPVLSNFNKNLNINRDGKEIVKPVSYKETLDKVKNRK